MRFLRSGAWSLLLAATTTVLETSCSHAPPPDVALEARNHEGKNVVVRFHATDGITYVTSSYAVTDSSIVIRNILRDTKYYAPTEAKLYDQTLTPAPGDITLPVEIAMTRIKSMDTWESRSATKDVATGVFIMVGIVATWLIYGLQKTKLGAGN